MGIQGLLPLLKSIHIKAHLSEFGGQRIAVDGYVWLHRGAYACAQEVVKGKRTVKYVDYFMHRVRMLQYYGIEPVIVFDGGPLPAKKGTEHLRKKKRLENLAIAERFLAEGRTSEAQKFFATCIDVTPEMAFQVIKCLKAESVKYIVAPYEADAQLAYLEMMGIVDGIITEDSDMLVYGCQNVLFKLDENGDCVQIKLKHLHNAADNMFRGWKETQFRQMAILSGCDYLPSINGMGIRTAHKLLTRYKTVENVLQSLKGDAYQVPPEYLDSFRMAELVFCHQRVYDPQRKQLTHLVPIKEGHPLSQSLDRYLGSDLDASIAESVANGDTNPISLQRMKDINPTYWPLPPARTSDDKVPRYHSLPTLQPIQNLPSGADSGRFGKLENPSEDIGTLKRPRETTFDITATPNRSRRLRVASPRKYTASKENTSLKDAQVSPAASSIIEVTSPAESAVGDVTTHADDVSSPATAPNTVLYQVLPGQRYYNVQVSPTKLRVDVPPRILVPHTPGSPKILVPATPSPIIHQKDRCQSETQPSHESDDPDWDAPFGDTTLVDDSDEFSTPGSVKEATPNYGSLLSGFASSRSSQATPNASQAPISLQWKTPHLFARKSGVKLPLLRSEADDVFAG